MKRAAELARERGVPITHVHKQLHAWGSEGAHIRNRPPKPCCRCGTAVRTHGAHPFCPTCKPIHLAAQSTAGLAVKKAVRSGALPKVTECLCVDCGSRAANYDHRDYDKSLDVEPVCRSCNIRRGPAASKLFSA